MPTLVGRDKVASDRKRLDLAFSLIEGVEIDAQLINHYCRYLCIRISGFVEEALKALVSEYARACANPYVHNYVSDQVSKVWGINRDKLQSVIQVINPDWWKELEENFQTELEALHSIGKTRDNVSHGGDQGVTKDTVTSYRDQVYVLVRQLEKFLDVSTRPNG